MAGGVLLGGLVVALWMRRRLEQTFQALADAALRSNQSAFLDAAKTTLETVGASMRGDLSQRQTAIEGLVKPLNDSLARLDTQVRSVETERQKGLATLRQEVDRLAKETVTLSHALRTPQGRGRWGEITLRRVAELSGMARQCDFYEQETVDGDVRIRPDMVVRLPGDRTIVVDSKVPLSSYLDAVSATEEAVRKKALENHARQVATHVASLSAKQYWTQFQPAPELVVLFLPGDHFLNAALDVNPELVESALAQKVMLATPSTLIAILKAIEHGWRQEQLAANAEEIRRVALEFYDRLQMVNEHYEEAGRSLAKAVESYNKSVASWEARLLPSLRRIRELGVSSGSEPEAPKPIDASVRQPISMRAEG